MQPDPVFVVGHVNHDRVWHLDSPLVSGQRLSWKRREVRIGGGGYFTGIRLLALRRRVELVSQLSSDARGEAVAAQLAREGFSLRHTRRDDAPHALTEILLSPDGERTIIGSGHARPAFALERPPAGMPAAAYVNARRLEASVTGFLARAPLVVTQIPLGHADARPADVAVTSRADFPGLSHDDIHALAAGICGPRLRGLVVTDGPGPVFVRSDAGSCEIAPTRRLALADTIGAGDSFAAFLLHELLEGNDLARSVAAANGHMRAWLDRRTSD